MSDGSIAGRFAWRLLPGAALIAGVLFGAWHERRQARADAATHVQAIAPAWLEGPCLAGLTFAEKMRDAKRCHANMTRNAERTFELVQVISDMEAEHRGRSMWTVTVNACPDTLRRSIK